MTKNASGNHQRILGLSRSHFGWKAVSWIESNLLVLKLPQSEDWVRGAVVN